MHRLGLNLTAAYISSNLHLTSSECVDCYVKVVDTFPIENALNFLLPNIFSDVGML